MFAELLPLDHERAVETTVWLEFALAARTDAAFEPAAARLHDGVRQLSAIVLRAAGSVSERDVEVEAERLACLVDGLGLGGTLRPAALPADLARAVLRRHLESRSRRRGDRESADVRQRSGHDLHQSSLMT